jgi:hypothetical protein
MVKNIMTPVIVPSDEEVEEFCRILDKIEEEAALEAAGLWTPTPEELESRERVHHILEKISGTKPPAIN